MTDDQTTAGTLRSVLRDIRAVDGAVYGAVAATPTPTLDTAFRRLSAAADHSKISFTVAAALALVPGRPRRAALAGVGAIPGAAATPQQHGQRRVHPR
ncbi:phosphatase PAP2 family protein, partial [Streptomyces sp. NPDC004285]